MYVCMSLELAEGKRRKRLELFTFGHDEEWLRQRREEYATLAKETQKSCRRDKEAWWASIAEKMEHDAKSGRLKESYGVLKTFKSGVGRALATVKAKDGTLLETEVEVLNIHTYIHHLHHLSDLRSVLNMSTTMTLLMSTRACGLTSVMFACACRR